MMQNGGKPRLLMVSQWFEPEPHLKGLAFAKALQARGFEIEVVTGFPNYPGGNLYPGYRIRLWQREIMDGVPIMRLPLFPSHDKNAFFRSLNYLSFFASLLVYLIFFAKKSDIAYVYHPPMTVGLAAAIARLFRRTPTVVDIQDLWPDTLRATGMIGSPRLLGLIGIACRWLYHHVDHIVVLSPGFQRVLVSRGVQPSRITQIYNWATEGAAPANGPEDAPDAMRIDRRFRILFAGNMGKAQGLDAVLDAAKIVAERSANVEFVFMGGGVELDHLKARVAAESIDNVRFLPKVTMAKSGRYLGAADALLVHLVKDPLFEITIPSKTQAYMAAGQPIIMGVAGDAATLVENAQGGIIARSGDCQSIAAAVMEMAGRQQHALRAMGQANRDYYCSELSLDRGVTRFADLFTRMIEEANAAASPR